MIAALVGVTARAVLGRRRTVLLVLLALVPVLVALLARDRGASATETTAQVLDLLVVRAVLPIVALVLGTAVLGSELDDGTAVFVLTSPVARWVVVAAKLIVAAGGTAVIAGSSALLAGLIVATDAPSFGLVVPVLVGVLVGSLVYAAVFLALSLLTSRALMVGLLYTIVWEGTLASLFAGTRFLSVRQYVVGIADGIANAPGHLFGDTVPFVSAVALAVVALAGAIAIAVVRLSAWEVRGAD